MALPYPVSPNPLSNGDLGGHGRVEQVRRRNTDPGEKLKRDFDFVLLILALVYCSGAEIEFTKFWYLFEEVIWHYIYKYKSLVSSAVIF
jgi:hypothetical protein